MEDMRDTIGRNIRILRKQKGYTLQSMSKAIRITHQQLSRIENGGGTSTATLERIAAVLGVDISTLIDEPESTLQRVLPQTKSYISEQLCQQLYNRMYNDVIKVVNDVTLDKFMEDVTEKLIKNKDKIRNLLYTHVGEQSSYTFSPSALVELCQLMFVDFADHAMRLTKVAYEDADDIAEQE